MVYRVASTNSIKDFRCSLLVKGGRIILCADAIKWARGQTIDQFIKDAPMRGFTVWRHR